MGSAGSNDFGLTFACDGNLYVTSVSQKKLYRLNLNGSTAPVGDMGQNISALAAYGNPVQLYGLSNGLLANANPDTRSLYRINTSTGAATLIGALGGAAGAYNEAGLAFDSDGQLWAITDRRAAPGGPASQILRINTATGAATVQSTTAEAGFESLAITTPRGCTVGNGKTARFAVQKYFVDDNNISPVTLNLSCNDGLPQNQSVTVQPNSGGYGKYEATFVVQSFANGQMSCTVTETAVNGYTPAYTCLGESPCAAEQSSSSCVFNNVTIDSSNLCQIQNHPKPVGIEVCKDWVFVGSQSSEVGQEFELTLTCDGPVTTSVGDQVAENVVAFSGTGDAKCGAGAFLAAVIPDWEGNPDKNGVPRGTKCDVTENGTNPSVEPDVSDCTGIYIPLGSGDVSCTVTNTVFYEGIPTLSSYGMAILALLMLAAGVIAVRRI
jgi:hypothetical protein